MSTKIKLNGEWVDVANVSTSDVIRNPDWSRAVNIQFNTFVNGYTAPSDGILIFDGHPTTEDVIKYLYVNNHKVSSGLLSSTEARYWKFNCPVAEGDVIKIDDASNGVYIATFVPYKLTVPTSVEVVDTVANNNMNPVTSNAVYKNWKKDYGSAVVVNFTASGTNVDSVSVANEITMIDGNGVNHNIGKGSAHAFHMLYTDKGYLVFIVDVTVVFAVQIGTILTQAND